MNPLKIPSSWEHVPNVETRSGLLEQRRRNSIPHQSFDLDGDGAVGAHDLFLATKFDKDKDGILNEKERQTALAALNNGYAKDFVWGCESSGLNRSFRIVQKRGKVVMDEDFGKIRETYPVLQSNERTFTKSQLDEIRKATFKAESKQNEKRLNTTTQELLPVESFLCKDHYVSDPKYRSMSSKKKIEKIEARVKAGLTKEVHDVKTAEVQYKYDISPKNVSFSGMKESRRKNLVEKLNQSVDFAHETFYQKVENEKQYVGLCGKLKKEMEMDRRLEDVRHFEKTFAHRTLGIHGKELPKFGENIEQFMGPDKSTGFSQSFANPFALREQEYHRQEAKSAAVTLKPTEILHKDFESPTANRLNSKWTAFHSNFMPFSMRPNEIYEEHLKYISSNAAVKKQYRFLNSTEITPPITQRLLQKNYSPMAKFKSITSTGFSNR